MERVEKTIKRLLHARLQGPPVRPMIVIGEYDSTDPFAVTLVFPSGLRWTFAYDLLEECLIFDQAGEGDVRVCLRDDAAPEERVLLTLDSPEGHAEVGFDIGELVQFMRAVGQVMADTDLTIDWDAFLAEWLDGAA